MTYENLQDLVNQGINLSLLVSVDSEVVGLELDCDESDLQALETLQEFNYWSN